LRRSRLGAALALTLAALFALAPGAGAAERVVTVESDGPGPAQFDRVDVHQVGPEGAKRVLVLMPGTIGGAGNFALLAQDLVRRVPGLAVWSIDRRSNGLEDTSAFARLERGQASLQETFDYYLGWLVNGGNPAQHFQFLDPGTVPFAREWGMKTALDDARQVVRLAARRGGKVILGGHSLGASLAAAYAAWDFDGRPGYKDLSGLVLIDGGLLGSFDAYDLAQAQAAIADLQASNPFLDLLGLGVPEAAGLFGEIGGYHARLAPTASAAALQAFPLLPDAFDPGFPVTNRALLGHAFDRDTSPATLRLLHVNAGGLAGAGSPRDWMDGGITPVARLASMLGREPGNGVEWYFPRRLTIDTNGADEMRMNDVAQFLGLRLEHTDRIDLPIYAFQTDLTGGDVLAGAKRLIQRAKTSEREALLVNGAPTHSHLDPLLAAPGSNLFLSKLQEFLADYVRPPIRSSP
jgi:pimeloyl-ACP methyl ester carboxylesterase